MVEDIFFEVFSDAFLFDFEGAPNWVDSSEVFGEKVYNFFHMLIPLLLDWCIDRYFIYLLMKGYIYG